MEKCYLKVYALLDGTVNFMQDIIKDNTYDKSPEWNVTCHYDNYSKEPASFIECMALFMLAESQGWDISFMPSSDFFNDSKDGKGQLL